MVLIICKNTSILRKFKVFTIFVNIKLYVYGKKEFYHKFGVSRIHHHAAHRINWRIIAVVSIS